MEVHMEMRHDWGSWFVCVIVAALVVLALYANAKAHEAPSGWQTSIIPNL